MCLKNSLNFVQTFFKTSSKTFYFLFVAVWKQTFFQRNHSAPRPPPPPPPPLKFYLKGRPLNGKSVKQPMNEAFNLANLASLCLFCALLNGGGGIV